MLCNRVLANPDTYTTETVIIHMVYLTVFWMNAQPAMNEISLIHSPRKIVLKRSVDFDLSIQLDCSSVGLWDYVITFAAEVRF